MTRRLCPICGATVTPGQTRCACGQGLRPPLARKILSAFLLSVGAFLVAGGAMVVAPSVLDPRAALHVTGVWVLLGGTVALIAGYKLR